MDIVIVTPALAPFSGAPEPDDLVSGLSKALRAREHRVTVVSPLYRVIDPVAKALARRLTGAVARVGGREERVEIYDGRTAAGVDLVFLGHEAFGRAASFEDGGEHDRALRAAVLSRGAVDAITRLRTPAHVLHAHGWPGGLALVEAARVGLQAARVLTLVDAADTGRFPAGFDGALGLEGAAAEAARRAGGTWALRPALDAAQRVVFGAPGHARALAAEGAEDAALAEALRDVGDRLTGVAPGVDASIWNPATDARLTARFDPMDLSGKRRTRAALQHELGLPVREDVPLFGALVHASPERGADVLLEALPGALRNDVQVAVHVPGGDAAARELAGALEDLAARYSERLQVRRGDDDALVHRIVGGADFLIVPARRDPTGTWARIAHRYGTLPVVHATGGLADAVVDCDPRLRSGSGFVFEPARADALLAALQRAAAAAREGAFDALRERVMRIDHGWERAGLLFERLYRDAAA